MSQQLQRGYLLQQQNRPADAEREFRAALAQDPQDPIAHAALAECLIALGRLPEAQEEAQQAIVIAPDLPTVHYVMARVLLERNRFEGALSEVGVAIQFDSADADCYALRSAIYLRMEAWEKALAAADDALSIDPEHDQASNCRAIAQVQLGRQAEAQQTIQGTLERSPENAWTHAANGWAMLHANRPADAQVHFREALRLEPDNELARSGIVEAIKAGNPVYRVILAYFLWMSRLSSGARWGILLGLWFGSKLLRAMLKNNPSTEVLAYIVGGAYLLFVLMTWLAVPVFNLMLRLHPLGKHALSRDQRVGANLTGGCLASAVIAASVWGITGHFGWAIAGLVGLILAIPVSAIMFCSAGWPRRASAGIAIVLGVLGITATALAIAVPADPAANDPSLRTGMGLLGLFGLGCLVASFVNNYLTDVQPRR